VRLSLDRLAAHALAVGHNPDLRLLPGGLSQGRKMRVDPRQVERGILVELEHVDDYLVARQITLDHLAEDRTYYTKLARMQAGKCGR
jgi:hypothetical protein